MEYVLLGIVVVIVIYILMEYNKLIKVSNLVKEAFSTMDVYLKKRWDLIPNLVEIVKQYATYEKNTLEKVVDLRNNNYEIMNQNKKLNINKSLEECLTKILLISEAYPELKANETFIKLSKDLSQIEDEIANSRKYYNGTVRIYNNKVEMFPSNIIAKIFRFKSKTMFAVNNNEKKSVKVDL